MLSVSQLEESRTAKVLACVPFAQSVKRIAEETGSYFMATTIAAEP